MGETENSPLLMAATAAANDAQMLCEDIAQLLFPRVLNAPSEATLASTRLILQNLVLGIERSLDLSGNATAPASWDMLCRSGLLREAAFLEFALARHSEDQIRERVDLNGLELFDCLPNRLIHSADPVISECARNLVIAENTVQLNSPVGLVQQMPADLLHLLVWRIVAVFQFAEVQTGSLLIASANKLLASHDEAKAVQSAAAKLAYFLPQEERQLLADPVKAGVPLYVSGLAHDFGIPHDRILRFIAEDDVTPLLLLLRARGHDAQTALGIVQLLRLGAQDDHLLPKLMLQFEQVEPDAAKAEILSWRLSRGTVWKPN